MAHPRYHYGTLAMVDGLAARVIFAPDRRHVATVLEPQDSAAMEFVVAEMNDLRGSLDGACDWLKRLQEKYDSADTEGGAADIERLRRGLSRASMKNPLFTPEPTVVPEVSRLRDRIKELEAAHSAIRGVILAVENRCMAADGPVTPTLNEMTEAELRLIWQTADSAYRTGLIEPNLLAWNEVGIFNEASGGPMLNRS